MSRFIDKLNQASQGEPQPLGFRVGQSASLQPKMLLVASLPQFIADSLTDYVAGADAGLLPVSKLSSGIESLKQASQAVPDIPWGGWLKGISRKEMKQLSKLGCDFLVFPADASLEVAQDTKGGRILEVEASLSDGLLRTIDELPVDAVLIKGKEKEDYFLTWQQLMLIWRFADEVTKPLLVLVPAAVTAEELRLLWEAGVHGVVANAGVGGLKGLRQAIDKSPFPSSGRRRKTAPLLPHISAGTDMVAEEEEE